VQPLALFKLVFRVSGWVRNHLSRTGITLVFLTAFAGALGLNTEANLAHLIFSMGVGLVAIDAFAAVYVQRHAPKLSATRHLPQFVSFGERAQYRIALKNDGNVPMHSSTLVEVMAQPWPEKGGLPEGARKGYPAYLRMLRRWRVIEVQPESLSGMLPAQEIDLLVHVNPAARGLAVFQSMCTVVTGPLGLVEARVDVAVKTATLVVLPQRIPVDLPAPVGQPLMQTGGIALANHVGDSEEFRSLRDYRAGDPIRSIHWRSFARTGKPVVREYQQEFFARHTLVLDTACHPDQRPTFEAAVSIAAWLVARPLDADSLLDLMFVGDRVHRVTMGRSLGSADSLLRILAALSPTPPDSVEALLTSLWHNARELSSVIMIFQSWDERRQTAVSRLMAQGLRPVVLLIEPDAVAEPAVSPAIDAPWTGILRRLPLSSLRAIERDS
jgi:uncharacterized protein (DUF58 family)